MGRACLRRRAVCLLGISFCALPARAAPRLWVFGAETGSVSEAKTNTGTPAVSQATVRSGAYSLKTNGSNVSFLALPNYTAQSSVYARAYINFAALPSANNPIMQAFAGSNAVSTLMLNTDGKLTIKNGGSSGVTLGTSTVALSAGTWYRIDLKTVVSATAGIIELRIDGSVAVSSSNINTGTSNITGVGYGPRSASQDIFWDDIIEDGGAYPEEGIIIARQATTGAPTYNAWNKTGSDPYWADTPASTANQATSATGSNNAQTKLIASFSSTQSGHGEEILTSGATIYAFVVRYYQGSTTGPSGTYWMRQRIGGVNTDTAVTLTSGNSYQEGPYSSATLTGLNSMEAGGNSTTSGAQTQYTIADLWVMVSASATPRGCTGTSSVGSGNWSVASTWSPGMVPRFCTPVNILSGHTVTLDTTTAVSSGTTVNGTLSFSRVSNSSLTLSRGDLTVNAGGTLDMGSDASPIPTGITASLILSSGAVAGQYGLIVKSGGNFTVRGSTKTPFATPIGDVGQNATSMSMAASDVTGWQDGDEITIGKTNLSGTDETERRTISLSGTDPKTLSWTTGLSYAHYSTAGVIVANLTRNALIRSSGTVVDGAGGNSSYLRNLVQNATSFSLAYAELAFLGANAAGKYGVDLDGAGVQASLSSCTLREGYRGLYALGASTNTFTGNLFYRNADIGIYLDGSFNNSFASNHSYSNTSYGIYLLSSSRNLFQSNRSYSNASYGVLLSGFSPNNTLDSNKVYGNASLGVQLYNSANNTLSGNDVYSNAFYGIQLAAASAGNLLTGNQSHANSSFGLAFGGSSNNNVLVSERFYANQDSGIYSFNPTGSVLDGCWLGYSPSGALAPNKNAEIYFEPTATSNAMTLKQSRVNASVGISTAGFNGVGRSLLSYDQDYDTGTLRLWGDYSLSASTLTLDYASPLYASTATAPKLMRGVGHSGSVLSTNDANAVSQRIVVRYEAWASQWRVSGAVSGSLGTFSGSITNTSFPSGSPQFNLSFTPGVSPQDGDLVDFVLSAASQDSNFRKKMLFGPSANGFRGGRSKIALDATAGFKLLGVPGIPSLMDRLDDSSTYYTFVDSGAFTLSYATVTNADDSGLQLSGGGFISLASSTFDNAGQSNSSTGTYLTARALTNSATFYGLVFGNSRPNTYLYSVRVADTDTGLSWYMRRYGGAKSGKSSDNDVNDRVRWAPPSAPDWNSPANNAGFTLNRRPKMWFTNADDGTTRADAKISVSTSTGYEAAVSTTFQYSLNGAGWTGVPSGPSAVSTFTPTMDLTANTTTLYLRVATSENSSWSDWSTNLRILVKGNWAWTDPVLSTGTTVIRAVHASELRSVVDGVRPFRGLPVPSWTDPAIIAGTTTVRTGHITELRNNLSPAVTAVGLPSPSWTDPTLTPGSTVVKPVHFQELRNHAAEP